MHAGDTCSCWKQIKARNMHAVVKVSTIPHAEDAVVPTRNAQEFILVG